MSFDMARFRALLRSEREARVGARERLAEQVGVAKSTIQSAEGGPDIPGIDTVAKLVEGMPGLTLPAFFTQLEATETSSLNPTRKSTQDSSAVLLRSEVAHVEPSSIEALATQFATVVVDYVRRTLATRDRPVASARAQKPKGGRGVRRRQRKSS